jgi:hypothetical protein
MFASLKKNLGSFSRRGAAFIEPMDAWQLQSSTTVRNGSTKSN